MEIAKLLASEPLTCDSIAKAAGCKRATVKRIITELRIPAAYFEPIYTPDQANIVLRHINATELAKINNPNRKATHAPAPATRPSIDIYREKLDQRRQARAQANRH